MQKLLVNRVTSCLFSFVVEFANCIGGSRGGGGGGGGAFQAHVPPPLLGHRKMKYACRVCPPPPPPPFGLEVGMVVRKISEIEKYMFKKKF